MERFVWFLNIPEVNVLISTVAERSPPFICLFLDLIPL